MTPYFEKELRDWLFRISDGRNSGIDLLFDNSRFLPKPIKKIFQGVFMGLFWFSMMFLVFAGLILPIVYLFKSKPSVAIAWCLLGWSVGIIGGCTGFGAGVYKAVKDDPEVQKEIKEFKDAVNNYDKAIKELRSDLKKM